jgi:hypothetical protein
MQFTTQARSDFHAHSAQEVIAAHFLRHKIEQLPELHAQCVEN